MRKAVVLVWGLVRERYGRRKCLSTLAKQMYTVKLLTSLVHHKRNLQDTIEDMANGPREARAGASIEVGLRQDVVVDMRYVRYIESFGAPADGVFDPILLGRFIS